MNKLVYDKYKDQIVINERILKEKIINGQKIKMYLIYRVNFSYKTEQENKEKLAEIKESINEIYRKYCLDF